MHTVCHSILFSNFLIPKLNGVVHKTVWRVTLSILLSTIAMTILLVYL